MKKYLSILALLFFTTSCVETVVVGALATGVAMKQEKSTVNTKNDLLITAKLDKQFIESGLKDLFNKVGVTVSEQRVLLTGTVDNAKVAKKANELAWKVDGVKEVIDEIQIQEKHKVVSDSLIAYVKDASITAQISSKILLNKNISSINFRIITINKIVYLIGIAKNQDEISTISDVAARTVGVEKVINHIRISGK